MEPDVITVSVEFARSVADSLHVEAFTKAVEAAEAQELSTVEIHRSADGALSLVQPTGVMVGWFMPKDYYYNFAVEGGVDALHITVAYLGDVTGLDMEQQRTLIAVTAGVVAQTKEMFGYVQGTQVFDIGDGKRAWVANVTVNGLSRFHDDLTMALLDAGLPVDQTYDFQPHMTLAYLSDGQDAPSVELNKTPIYLGDMTVSIAGLNFTLKLLPLTPEEQKARDTFPATYENQTTPYMPIIKSVDEKRFTLAPVYIPGTLDAHGDHATADDLQEAMWEFTKGDKMIAIQHDKELAGHGVMVENMTIPFEHTVDFPQPDGTVEKRTFPAGTPWMGVVWDEAAWGLIKKGYFRGYSIGGRAAMLDIGLPTD